MSCVLARPGGQAELVLRAGRRLFRSTSAILFHGADVAAIVFDD